MLEASAGSAVCSHQGDFGEAPVVTSDFAGSGPPVPWGQRAMTGG